MNSIVAALERVGDDLLDVVGEAFGRARGLSETDVLEVMAAAGRIVRAGEALLVETTGQVCDRSDGRLNADRMTTRFGCGSASELVQRVTRVSKIRASDLVRAGRAVVRPMALTSGEVLPARLPAMRGALANGEVGVDGVVAVAGPLLSCAAGTSEILAADEELAATARGEGVDAAPPACAEDLRAMATVWAMYLDQDGAEPREDRAMRKRGFTFGMCRDGLVPGHGNFLPEVAAQLQLLFDSELNPRVDSVPVPVGPTFHDDEGGGETVDPSDPDAPLLATADRRTRAQKQHDVLASKQGRRVGHHADPRGCRTYACGLGTGGRPRVWSRVRAHQWEAGRVGWPAREDQRARREETPPIRVACRRCRTRRSR